MSAAVPAFAAGTTSGPAAGKDVAPTTSMKSMKKHGHKGNAKVGSKMAPTGAHGAPGVAGKKGSKSGAAQSPSGK
jgi:hypothetical protein